MSSSLEYLAGLFDGEGCFHISKSLKPRHTNPSYMAIASVSMKHTGAMAELVSVLGGTVLKEKKRDIYTWRVYGKQVAVIAEKLLPYLRVKGEEANVILEFQRHMADTPHKGYGYSLSKQTIEIRERLRNKLRDLNAAT